MPKPLNTLEAEALKLSIPERAKLAQLLWSSIAGGPTDIDESQAIEDAKRRDADMSSGKVAGELHDDVIRAARRALR